MADLDQPLMPTTGKHIWKEDASGNHSLEWISNNPNADRDRRRKKGNEGNKRNDRVASGVGRNQQGKGRGRANQPKSAKHTTKQADSQNTVTLDLIKSVALDMLSEDDQVAEDFERLYRTEQFDKFLLHLLTYFNCFFEKLHQEHKQNISTYIEPSLSEKQAYADSLVKLKVAERYLGQTYCVLVLGLGLKYLHHMACGIDRVSATARDRSMYETVYAFCTFVVWITFRRKDYEAVRKEVGRMLRSDIFNPAIRVKNAPEEKETDRKEDQSEEDGKKEVKLEKKITPAEYRRLHPRRPAIKSIIYQRSPAVVAILPSPKEEADWLFKKSCLASPDYHNKVGITSKEELHDANEINFAVDKKKFKIGILGDVLSQYNHVTLMPLGAENEDEDNEGEDGEQKQANDVKATETQPLTDRGVSRSQTGVSETVTEAFTND